MQTEDAPYAGSEAEDLFKQRWHEGSCFKVNLCWPGQGSRRRWIVTRAPYWSGVDGSGRIEAEAWENAAERLKQSRA